MKTILLFIRYAACSLVLVVSSCEKNEGLEPPFVEPILRDIGNAIWGQIGPQFRLTDGNSTTSYFPLAINHEWKYERNSNPSLICSIKSTRIFGSTVYFELENSLGNKEYYRTGSDGNIWTVDTVTAVETMCIPEIPFVNQEWTNLHGEIEKVISLSEKIETPSCVFNDCLKIQSTLPNGDVVAVRYYKRGIGLVLIVEFRHYRIGKMYLYAANL